MNTTCDTRSPRCASSRCQWRTWSTISPAVRFRTSPISPVAQKAQAIGQPACVDTHTAPPTRARHGALAARLHFTQAQPAPAGGDVRNAALDLERAVIGAAAADGRRAKDPNALAVERHKRAGVGRERAHHSRELLG